MLELRVTSCWFGKTVEEVERRRFVKLKRCVLEPAARGLWYLKFSDSKTMSFEEFDTTAFCLRAKDSVDGLCDGSVVELEKKPVATIQKQHNFSSWRLATQTSYSPRKFRFSRREARHFVQETPPVEIRKDCSCVQGRFRAVTVELREGTTTEFLTPFRNFLSLKSDSSSRQSAAEIPVDS
ncbi:kinesin-4 [Dorcoceras hygrometricum]|uniref:Kinesin-4 n=1 Tax=Dorcoceras hygrometricum TaxID=472368 RepID=A0A2Z7ARR0_9LAMI|nr:kinesin-4 [Dorcoceras hygrometricum]